MENWIWFIVFYASLSLLALAFLLLLVRALVAIVRIEKKLGEMVEVLVQSEKYKQKEQFRQQHE